MNCKNNVVVAALAGVVAGTLMGAGASQYAYVIAGWDPNVAKYDVIEELRSSAPRGTYEVLNRRYFQILEEEGDAEVPYREVENVEGNDANFHKSKYAEDGPCAGMSGKRRNVCEAGRN